MTPEEKIKAIAEIVDRLNGYAQCIDSWSSHMSIEYAIQAYCDEIREIIEPD